MTEFHASYNAHKLILKNNSTNTEKLVRAIMNSEIDVLPHQIEAALFFNSSLLSEGVLIADEVGLGKTIEAGLILRQYWNEGKQKILIIAPASLRRQWGEELRSKFFIDSVIMDTNTYKTEIKSGNKTPLIQDGKVVICSYHFAAKYKQDIIDAQYDLAVLDEAHKVRNSWKESGAKTSVSIREALFGTKKLLLTATPLHNSMKDLVGILQFIDDSLDASQWKDRKKDSDLSLSEEDYRYLESRVESICNRTLRSDVTEYIKYTNRKVLLHEYEASEKEQLLYNEVLDFFNNNDSALFGKKAKNLLQMAALKLLSSSPKAVSSFIGTLLENYRNKASNIDITEFIDIDNDDNLIGKEVNIALDESQGSEELDKLEAIKELADSITKDSKLTVLAEALETGFQEQIKIGADKKVIIFTESIQTQHYLKEHLDTIGYKDKIVIFNGENNSPDSIAIYNNWKEMHKGSELVSGIKSVDMKQALIDHFRESADIMISTESGGEGINLQFANMIVNYDLPWNPQRIEQRIGRCHRYGQKYDVLIVNFLNTNNMADRRVYELLDEKFKLFDGIFGSSNEILGAIESGVDIEQKIHKIYSSCENEEEMKQEFDKLEGEIETGLHIEQKSAQYKLLDNLSTGKQLLFRERKEEIDNLLKHYRHSLWELAKFTLDDNANIVDEDKKILELHTSPHKDIPQGYYSVYRDIIETGRLLRENTPLGHYIFSKILRNSPEPKKLVLKYDDSRPELSDLIGMTGFLKCSILRTRGFEDSEHLLLSAIDDDLEAIEHDKVESLFKLPVINIEDTKITKSVKIDLEDVEADFVCTILEEAEKRNIGYLQQEEQRLSHIANQKIEIKKDEAEKIIDALQQKQYKKGGSFYKQVDIEKEKLEEEIKKIHEEKDNNLAQLKYRLNQPIEQTDIFSLEWEIV